MHSRFQKHFRVVTGAGSAAALLDVFALVGATWLFGTVELRLGAVVTVRWSAALVLAPLALYAAMLGARFVLVRTRNPAVAPPPHRLCHKILLSGYSALLCLAAVEWTLGRAGVETELPALVIRGEEDQGVRRKRPSGLVSDARLRWRFGQGKVVWGIPINSLGYRDREYPLAKPGRTKRVLCVGDSCTAIGHPPYSLVLHRMLTNSPPVAGLEWEACNMGVFGYSTTLGLRDFQDKAAAIAPDIVTVYYGWNDHWWSGVNKTDSEIVFLGVSRTRADLIEGLGYRRAGALLARAFLARSYFSARKDPGAADCYRVPPDEYAANLRRFVREIRDLGAVPVLMTAPRAPAIASNLVTCGNISSVPAGLRIHDQYVALTRTVARETGSRLIDLFDLFGNPGRTNLFSADGIHLRQAGLDSIASAIHQEVRRISLPGSGQE